MYELLIAVLAIFGLGVIIFLALQKPRSRGSRDQVLMGRSAEKSEQQMDHYGDYVHDRESRRRQRYR